MPSFITRYLQINESSNKKVGNIVNLNLAVGLTPHSAWKGGLFCTNAMGTGVEATTRSRSFLPLPLQKKITTRRFFPQPWTVVHSMCSKNLTVYSYLAIAKNAQLQDREQLPCVVAFQEVWSALARMQSSILIWTLIESLVLPPRPLVAWIENSRITFSPRTFDACRAEDAQGTRSWIQLFDLQVSSSRPSSHSPYRGAIDDWKRSQKWEIKQ